MARMRDLTVGTLVQMAEHLRRDVGRLGIVLEQDTGQRGCVLVTFPSGVGTMLAHASNLEIVDEVCAKSPQNRVGWDHG